MELSRLTKAYAFKHQEGDEVIRLLYIGEERGWHQFVKEEDRFGTVWSELLPSDLWMLVEIGDANLER
jgi:hypothetical protein